ncbi:cathepsin S-like [Arapaima gigas]
MDCSAKYRNEDCKGCFMHKVFKCIIENQGIESRGSHPYTGKPLWSAQGSWVRLGTGLGPEELRGGSGRERKKGTTHLLCRDKADRGEKGTAANPMSAEGASGLKFMAKQ